MFSLKLILFHEIWSNGSTILVFSLCYVDLSFTQDIKLQFFFKSQSKKNHYSIFLFDFFFWGFFTFSMTYEKSNNTRIDQFLQKTILLYCLITHWICFSVEFSVFEKKSNEYFFIVSFQPTLNFSQINYHKWLAFYFYIFYLSTARINYRIVKGRTTKLNKK